MPKDVEELDPDLTRFLLKLCRKKGIDAESPECWFLLAARLALDHELPRGKAGRPIVWDDDRLFELYVAVQKVLARRPQLSEAAARRSLKKQYGLSEGRLGARYTEAKKMIKPRGQTLIKFLLSAPKNNISEKEP